MMKSEVSNERLGVLGEKSRKRIIKSVLTALFISLLLGGAGLIASALLLSLTVTGTTYISTVGCAVGACTSLIGGFIAGRRQKHTGALAGVLFGIVFVGVLLLLGRFFNAGTPLPKRLIGYTVFLLLSALGGALGTVRGSGRRHGGRRHFSTRR